MEKSIEKALQDAGLTEREVTAFMRVRVVGLRRKTYQGKSSHEDGFITIWNPTEKQVNLGIYCASLGMLAGSVLCIFIFIFIASEFFIVATEI